MTELTDEQIAREEKFLEGIPRLNIGALFLPPIWGPAHGMWAAILFYPIWLFADNTFYAAFTERTPLAIGIALIVLLTLTVGTVVFAILGQPFAAHRAAPMPILARCFASSPTPWRAIREQQRRCTISSWSTCSTPLRF